ncbi:tetratricopeptide repeat family protein, partial [Orientia tsutsugamushi str. TA763]
SNCEEAYLSKGVSLGKLGQLQKAIENFDLAIKHNLIMKQHTLIKEFVCIN